MSRRVSTHLSLDLGTTAVKAAIVDVDASTGEATVLFSTQRHTEAYLPRSASESEQSIDLIFSSIDACIGDLPRDALVRCTALDICDQMHGIVLWDGATGNRRSPLYTWEDSRVHTGELRRINNALFEARSRGAAVSPVHPGYGLLTASHLLIADPSLTRDYTACGTLGSYLAAVLIGKDLGTRALIDATDAASLGIFEAMSATFHAPTLQLCAPMLAGMLPRVVRTGLRAGSVHLSDSFRRVFPHLDALCSDRPHPLHVTVSMGDHPASVAAAVCFAKRAPSQQQSSNVVVVSIGTSAQVAAIGPAVDAYVSAAGGFVGNDTGLEVRPFVKFPSTWGSSSSSGGGGNDGCPVSLAASKSDHSLLASTSPSFSDVPARMLVGASVNGGNVTACVAATLGQWMSTMQRSSIHSNASATFAANSASATSADAAIGDGLSAPLSLSQQHPITATPAGAAAQGVAIVPQMRLDSTDVSFMSLEATFACLERAASDSPRLSTVSPMRITPCLAPERVPIGWGASEQQEGGHASSFAIAGITSQNASLGELWAAVADSIVANVCDMLPASVWSAADTVVSTGGALAKSPALKRYGYCGLLTHI